MTNALARTQRIGRAKHSSSARNSNLMLVTYTLLALYTLPLFVIGWVALITEGFKNSAIGLDFTISIAGVFMSPTRDALATFVVPFIMAYSISTVRKGAGIGREALHLFIILVGLFLVALCAHCIVNMRMTQLIHQLHIANQQYLDDIRKNLSSLTQSYIKETLAYISLILGISQTDSRNNDIARRKVNEREDRI